MTEQDSPSVDRQLAHRVAHVAHELRTPLVGAQGLLVTLAGSPLAEEQRELVDEAARSVSAMLRIVNDALLLGQGDDVQPAWVESALDFARCARTAARLASGAAGGAPVDVHLAPDLPRAGRGDGARIQQILLNLIGNAIKFSHAQPVTLHVRPERDRVAFEVADRGPGVPEHERDAVFRPYARGSTSEGVEGLGIGLSISRRIAEAMGGTLTLEPSPVGGARFVLRLPLVVPSVPLPSLRILLADDDAASRLIGRRVLERAGHRVDCFVDGESALAGAMAIDYDVLLLDVQMPRSGAAEVVAELRASGSGIPIVALSASGDAATSARLAELDVHLVPKPFDLDRVTDAIVAARAR